MSYSPDILGNKFKQKVIELKDDYEGKAVATLVRSLSNKSNNTAILYIHGFNDYFFQEEMAHQFNELGYNFYALDLRKYGRSVLPHQKFNDIRDLKDYYEEIHKSIGIIHAEDNNKVILMGHSTGGLIITLFAKDNTGNNIFDGIILNSPFYDFNMSSKTLERLIPLASMVGSILPNIKVDDVLSEEYGESLHKDYNGEWDYILDWKPNTPPPISLGWLRAIRNGHKELQAPFNVVEPVLVLHSTKTITNKFDYAQMHTMDAVLSVIDIDRVARNIKGDVQITPIKDGMHDLILSKKDVRENVYDVMMKWMTENIFRPSHPLSKPSHY